MMIPDVETGSASDKQAGLGWSWGKMGLAEATKTEALQSGASEGSD